MEKDKKTRRKKKVRSDFEIRFYKKLLERKPDFTDALHALGHVYTRRGLYEEGLEVDRRLSEIKPHDPIVFYNLACTYSLIGKIDEALKCLKKAIIFNYNDFSYLEEDPDLENLRKDPRYQDLRKKIIKLIQGEGE